MADGNLRNIRGTAVGEGDDFRFVKSKDCSIDSRRRGSIGEAVGEPGRLGGNCGRSRRLPTSVGVLGRLGGRAGRPVSFMTGLGKALTGLWFEWYPLSCSGYAFGTMSGGSVIFRRTPKKDNGCSTWFDFAVYRPTLTPSRLLGDKSSSSTLIFRF